MNRKLKQLTFLLPILAVMATQFIPAEAAPERRPASVTCVVDILNEFRAQNGTLLRSEVYQRTFVLTETAGFFEDYSTFTRFKEFSATMQRGQGQTTVSIDWFADVSVFDSTDLQTAVTLAGNQKSVTAGASQTFSSTPGHSTTSWTLTVTRD